MHIVIASVFDPIPSDGISLGRYHFLSRALKEKGHKVTYLTSGFLHATKSFRSTADEEIDGIKYIKVPSRGYTQNIGISRLADHFVIAKNARAAVEKIHSKEKIDIVLCASPPLFWSNFIFDFCSKNNITSVLDLQDNWPRAFESVNSFIYKTTLNALPFQLLSRQNIRLANIITAVTYNYLKPIRNKRTAVFYLGAPVSKIQESLKKTPTTQPGKLRLVFMGNMSSHQPLLGFLNDNRNENIEVVYIGECRDERIKRHKLVNYTGPLYDTLLYKALAENDYGLFINDSYKQISMPNKLFYYWACGLPVLGIDVKGEANGIIINMHGVILNNESLNTTDLKNRLSEINKEEIKQKALRYYDEKVIYTEFTSFLEGLVRE